MWYVNCSMYVLVSNYLSIMHGKNIRNRLKGSPIREDLSTYCMNNFNQVKSHYLTTLCHEWMANGYNFLLFGISFTALCSKIYQIVIQFHMIIFDMRYWLSKTEKKI